MSYSLINDSSVLDIRNAHLRVAGNVEAQAIKVGAVELNAGYSLERTANVGNTTSNTIQFTNEDTSFITSGNVNIGKNLNILYTDNVATIEANSNVVTEFPRSKKLIKYPRVAMTGPVTSGYVVTASSTLTTGTPANVPYTVFDESLTSFWHTQYPYYNTSNGSYAPGQTAGGTGTPANGTTLPTNELVSGHQGEWISIELPNKIKLDRLKVVGSTRLASGVTQFPKDVVVAVSDTGLSGSWSVLQTATLTSQNVSNHSVTINITTDASYYKYFALIVKSINSTATYSATEIGQLEYYGIPEYDPDADGVDVKVTSYPNVPNADWLEVYYDAKDLTTTPGTITDLSTNSRNGSINGNVTVSDGAFVFDGSGDYISTTLNGLTGGNLRYAVSMWIKMDRFGAADGTNVGYIYALGNANANGQKTMVYVRQYNTGQDPKYQLVFAGYTYDYAINKNNWVLNKWYHIVVMHEGSDRSFSGVNAIAYVDGVRVDCHLNNVSSGGNAGNTLSIANNPTLTIGGNGSVESYSGSIANFRLFDRLLSDDEVHQLYAYQKEYFGHGDLSMTLKSGRLGIGISEPRAALDVKGNVRIGGTIQVPLIISHRYISGNDTTVTSGNYIPFNGVIHEYPPGIHNGNYFTCPVKGIYECHADMLVDNGGNYDGNHEWYKNVATMSPRRRGYGQQNSGNLHNQATSHYYIECDAGDTLSLMGVSTVAWYGSDTYSHSHMSIRLITAT